MSGPSPLRRLSQSIELHLQMLFYRIGLRISGYPKTTCCLLISLAITLSVGSVNLFVQNRLEKLWVPQNTLALEHNAWVEREFPQGVRVSQIIFRPQNAQSLGTKEHLLEMIQVLNVSAATTAEYKSETITFDELCVKEKPHCTVRSVLDLFYDPTREAVSRDFLEIVRQSILPLSEEDIERKLRRGPYKTWNNKTLLIEEFMNISTSSQIQAFQVMIFLNENLIKEEGTSSDPSAEAWEQQWIARLTNPELLPTASIRWFINAPYSVEQSTEESLTGDLPKAIIGYNLLMLYVACTMGDFHLVRSRVLLAMGSFFCVGLALGATFGVASLCGLMYSPVHQVLPLLLLGIGMDDAYVILNAFDATDPQLPVANRVAKALSHAGSSITVTSLTNSCAFFIGSMTQIPALSSFAVWAGIGVLFDFVFQSSVFIAFLYWDAERQRKNHRDIFPCIPVESMKEENACGCLPGILSRRFEYFGTVLFNLNSAKAALLSLCFVLFGFSVYGITQLEQEFQIEFFYLDGTYSQKFNDNRLAYFPARLTPFAVYSGELDYSSNAVQQELFNVYGPTGSIAENPYVENNSIDCWYLEFRDYANATADDQVIPPDTFYAFSGKFDWLKG